MIDASLAHWDELGTRAWCGYSFSWMSCLRARVGDGESALRLLDIFVRAFVLRNGFHVNGDQTRSGFSNFTYRPFTLEGNFLAAQAVQEMLLQSWSPTPGRRDTEVIRIFPATPWRWHDAAFRELRAEGGYRVSARRENNATTWFRVVAARAGVVRIHDNFDGRTPRWSLPGVERVGVCYEVRLSKGQAVEAALAKPAAIPAAPALRNGRKSRDGAGERVHPRLQAGRVDLGDDRLEAGQSAREQVGPRAVMPQRLVSAVEVQVADLRSPGQRDPLVHVLFRDRGEDIRLAVLLGLQRPGPAQRRRGPALRADQFFEGSAPIPGWPGVTGRPAWGSAGP
jgi:hypothetical protein